MLRADGIVAVADAPACLQQRLRGRKDRAFGREVCKRAKRQQLRDSDYAVAVLLQQRQLFRKRLRNRRAPRHIVPIFLEDDLPAQTVRVLRQRALHGAEHRVYLGIEARKRQPACAVEACREILVAEQCVRVVAGKAVFGAIHIVRRARESDRIAIVAAHELVEPPEVLRDLGKIFKRLPAAVDQRFRTIEDVTVGVAGDFVSAVQNALDKLRAVNRTAVGVLMNIGVVVVSDAAPGRRARFSGLVGIVFRGIADDIKCAVCAERFQRLQKRQRQRRSV